MNAVYQYDLLDLLDYLISLAKNTVIKMQQIILGESSVSTQDAARIIADASKSSEQAAERAEKIISDFSRLNYLACSVIRALSTNDFLSEAWLHEKAAKLNGKDKYDVVLWISNLDSGNMERVANELNISIENLNVTLETLRSI
jgi:hypothetical protein